MIPNCKKQIEIVFCFFVFTFPNLTSQYHTKSPYCNITCDGKKHTMCAYPDKGPPECSSFTTGLTEDQATTIVRVHNELRNLVASGKEFPAAANMMKMIWSEEAAAIAQRWADQCTELNADSDECRTLLDGEAGGQLVAFTGKIYLEDTYNFIRTTLMDWYHSNKTYVKIADLASFKYNRKTFAFTQMMWAKSDRVGCGVSIGLVDDQKVHKLVCNYYPGGNIEGQPVYEQGVPCSRCPCAKCDTRWDALCQHEVHHNNDVSGSSPTSDSYGFFFIITSVILEFYLIFVLA